MPKRHRYLLGLITLASLFTVLFQCFWLYGNYQHEKMNFIASTERLLFESMQEEREARLKRIAPEEYQLLRKRLMEMEKSRPGFRRKENHIMQPPIWGMSDRLPFEKERKDRVMIMGLRGDSIKNRGLGPRFMEMMGSVDFDSVKHRFYHKMKQLDLQDDFQLKKFSLARNNQGNVLTEKSSSYPIHVATMMLDPAKDLMIYLDVRIPFGWIFTRLAWALISSFSLMILTIGCLVYLLYTIFKQKKLADIKNDFVNNMTHELKTPLATVLAAVESLQQQFSSPKGLQQYHKTQVYLQMTHNAATHLTNIIDQILRQAVGENKQFHLQIEKVNTSALLRQLIETHQLTCSKDVNFSLEEVENREIYIDADRIHISNAINNLLDNAIKYTDKPANIQLKTTVHQKKWTLSVTDNGVGMAAGDLKQIFQPFYRIPTGNIHKTKGFGLGLYYVKQVITQHKGEISVNSTLGKGSTFTICLPLN